MKSNSFKLLPALGVGLLVLGLGSFAAQAGATNMVVATRNMATKTAPVKSASEAAAVLPDPSPVPQSVFVVPRKVAEGKDPFFPNSSRVYGVDATAKPGTKPQVVADIVLRGISGTAEEPLAIINTTTCTTGETAEIITKNSRLKIQCLEINMAAGTVLLQIGAERRELRLGSGK